MTRDRAHDADTTIAGHGFIAGGRLLAEEMVRAEHRQNRPRLLAEARAKCAAEFAAATWLGRLMLRRRIRREVAEILRRELDRLASTHSLY